MAEKLNPPIIDGIIKAQMGTTLQIPFQMNRSVSRGEINHIVATIKTVSTNKPVFTNPLQSYNIYYQNNQWWATFEIDNQNPFKVGQYYKIQLAYNNEIDGFYSTVGTFKYTSIPSVSIQGLNTHGATNINTYEYTGSYINAEDPSEKVYSYWFNIYELGKETPILTSGELLHNSSNDLNTDSSVDVWTTNWSRDGDYVIQYFVKTINGLEVYSPPYRITDNQLVQSNILDHYDFVVKANADGGYAELAIQPKSDIEASDRKLINGQFILLRASSEDNFQSWYKMTEFILTNWDSSTRNYLCRDYCVAQGVTYIYALQAFNSRGVYSKRIEAKPIMMDFEDMYLSDGERQLRIRFNPKVSSFKNTILEAKMDTIGGKYPFFFRNGNVKYKEFPISGLISMLMDEHGDFMSGLEIKQTRRTHTQDVKDYYTGKILKENMSKDYFTDFPDSPIMLTANNFRKERDFKNEVLEWLTNGRPKLFRSPGEGNFIVRLMNTSLSPNDTLSRMIHTFSSTAYEIADCTFENLRAFGMLMDEKLEVRDLEFAQVNLSNINIWNGCAVMASITGAPNCEFKYRLQNDTEIKETDLGATGVYEFDKKLLAENPLVYLSSRSGIGADWRGAILTYGYYVAPLDVPFSIIDNISTNDKIECWIGQNRDEIAAHVDTYRIKESIDKIFYLKIQERPVRDDVTEVIPSSGGRHVFKKDGVIFNPSPDAIIEYNQQYYDGRTTALMGNRDKIDFRFSMSNNATADMDGQYYETINTNGRIILTELDNINYLYLGNGLYADVVYQATTKYYSVEKYGIVKYYKDLWEQNPSDLAAYERYYNSLINALEQQQGGLSVDAL